MTKKITGIIFIALISLLFLTAVSAKGEKALVSPALKVLAANTDMAKAAVVGDNIGFTAEDFERSLCVGNIASITIEELPSETDGKLMLGTAALSAAQSVSGDALDVLTFVPASEDVKSGSFVFSDGGGYSIRCNLYFIDKVNYSPTTSLASESTLRLRTHDSVAKCGRLDAYDPEGDKIIYEIVSYPTSGSVVLLDRESGSYIYTPSEKYTGNDSFSYVARDIYGNYSAKASVDVSVRARQTSAVFGDIYDCDTYNAALTMAENSLMEGTNTDGTVYFVPTQTISRAEFLTTAMKAAGMTVPTNAEIPVFDDDADIAGEYKNYVGAAYRLGFINGSEIDGKLCFLPNASITRAEAAVMLDKILSETKSVSTPVVLPVFADTDDVPAWASEAVRTMHSLGVIDDKSGYVSPEGLVTRGDAAKMFEAVIELCE